MLHAPIPHRLVDDAEPPAPAMRSIPVDVRWRSHPLLPARPTGLAVMPALSSQSAGWPPHSYGVAHRRGPSRRTGDTS